MNFNKIHLQQNPPQSPFAKGEEDFSFLGMASCDTPLSSLDPIEGLKLLLDLYYGNCYARLYFLQRLEIEVISEG